MLRLVRPAAEDLYERENARFRDVARPFSTIRDAQALVETYDALVERFESALDAVALAPLRGVLADRRRELARSGEDLDDRLQDLEEQIRTARALGRRVFAEKPKHLARRWEASWHAWRGNGEA